MWWDVPLSESFLALRQIYDVPASDYRERLLQLTELLDLSHLLKVPVRQLSLGQRMRGELAACLLHRPRVLFLDEPTIGVDAVGKVRFREFLREWNRREGVTVMLTSHDLGDVEQLCHRVILLDRGRVRFDGTPSHVVAQFRLRSRLIVAPATRVSQEGLSHLFTKLPEGATGRARGDGSIEVDFDRGATGPAQILDALRDIPMADMRLEEASLADAFVQAYGSTPQAGAGA